MLFQIDYKDGEKDKVTVDLAPQDTWSVDITLAHVIVPLLKQLKATTNSSGKVEDCDVPQHLVIGDDENNWPLNSRERWEWLLDELIWVFEQHIDPTEEDAIFIPGQPVDMEAWKAWNERKGKAFVLFGKYYASLWD